MQTNTSTKRESVGLLEEILDIESQEVDYRESKKNILGIRIGEIVSITDENIKIDYPDNPYEPMSARTIIDISIEDKGRKALLVFENGDPNLPIIIGLLKERISAFMEYIVDKEETVDIIKDGERIVFDAEKEIELKCGKSSILMKKDGKIVIKGRELISRASEANKIKGAYVNIN